MCQDAELANRLLVHVLGYIFHRNRPTIGFRPYDTTTRPRRAITLCRRRPAPEGTSKTLAQNQRNRRSRRRGVMRRRVCISLGACHFRLLGGISITVSVRLLLL